MDDFLPASFAPLDVEQKHSHCFSVGAAGGGLGFSVDEEDEEDEEEPDAEEPDDASAFASASFLSSAFAASMAASGKHAELLYVQPEAEFPNAVP